MPEFSASPSGRMPAVVQRSYGGTGVLRIEQVPVPEFGPKDVLVRVHAAGLAKGDWHIMTGTPYLLRAFFGLRRPRQEVLGHNLAGTVAAVGSAVTRFRPGDEVYGIGRGSFAQYCAAPGGKLALKPANLDFDTAAAVPVSGLTALQAVCVVGKAASGQRVLILGAAGGVGSFAVQLAHAAGAEVTGSCQGSKAGFVRSLGAAGVIDYTTEDFAAVPRRFDLIIDIAGSPRLSRLRRALTPRGTAVLVGGEEGRALTGGMVERQVAARAVSLFSSQRLAAALARESGSELAKLTPLIEAGTLVPRIDSRYPLADAAEAMARLESGRVQGNVVLAL